jgi:hypothetical protein
MVLICGWLTIHDDDGSSWGRAEFLRRADVLLKKARKA